MFATARDQSSTRTSIIAAAIVGVAALAGQVLFLDQQVAGPLTAALPSGRPQLVEGKPPATSLPGASA